MKVNKKYSEKSFSELRRFFLERRKNAAFLFFVVVASSSFLQASKRSRGDFSSRWAFCVWNAEKAASSLGEMRRRSWAVNKQFFFDGFVQIGKFLLNFDAAQVDGRNAQICPARHNFRKRGSFIPSLKAQNKWPKRRKVDR